MRPIDRLTRLTSLLSIFAFDGRPAGRMGHARGLEVPEHALHVFGDNEPLHAIQGVRCLKPQLQGYSFWGRLSSVLRTLEHVLSLAQLQLIVSEQAGA